MHLIYSPNKEVPSVINSLAIYDEQDGEPFKLRTDTSHQISFTVTPYTVTNLGESKDFDLNSQPLDQPNCDDKLKPLETPNTDNRSAPQKVS